MKYNLKNIIPHLIIIFGIYFSVTFSNGFCFGDEVLNTLGLKSWTDNQSGFHITAAYSLIIILTGILLLSKMKKTSFKSVLNNIIVYLFVVSLIFAGINKYIYKKEVINSSNSSYNTNTYKLGLNGDVSIKNMSILKDKKQIIVPVFIEGDININSDDIKLIDDKNNSYDCLGFLNQKTAHKNDCTVSYFDAKFNVHNTKDVKYYKIAFFDSKGQIFAVYIYNKDI
jgi:hypothetical protein